MMLLTLLLNSINHRQEVFFVVADASLMGNCGCGVFHIYITRGIPGVAPGAPTDGLTEGPAGPNARFYHCLTH